MLAGRIRGNGRQIFGEWYGDAAQGSGRIAHKDAESARGGRNLNGISQDQSGLHIKIVFTGLQMQVDVFVIGGEEFVRGAELANEQIQSGEVRTIDFVE